MLGFIKRCLYGISIFIDFNKGKFVKLYSMSNSLSCISMSNQEFRVRQQIANVKGDDPFSVKTSK